MPDAQMAADSFIAIAWVTLAALWAILSINVKRTVRHETQLSRLLHLGPLALAVLLLLDRSDMPNILRAPLIQPRAAWMAYAGAVLVAAGLGLCIWARLVIGTNWSGSVTVKQSHELVTSGPYALARHPIYTGLLLAFLGTSIAMDEARGILALVIVALLFLRKMRTEEAFMRATFGAQYDAYSARVAALVPGVF